jgi:hypothetical protein
VGKRRLASHRETTLRAGAFNFGGIFGGFLRFFALRKSLISRVIPRYSTKFHSEKIKLDRRWTRINADRPRGRRMAKSPEEFVYLRKGHLAAAGTAALQGRGQTRPLWRRRRNTRIDEYNAIPQTCHLARRIAVNSGIEVVLNL